MCFSTVLVCDCHNNALALLTHLFAVALFSRVHSPPPLLACFLFCLFGSLFCFVASSSLFPLLCFPFAAGLPLFVLFCFVCCLLCVVFLVFLVFLVFALLAVLVGIWFRDVSSCTALFSLLLLGVGALDEASSDFQAPRHFALARCATRVSFLTLLGTSAPGGLLEKAMKKVSRVDMCFFILAGMHIHIYVYLICIRRYVCPYFAHCV